MGHGGATAVIWSPNVEQVASWGMGHGKTQGDGGERFTATFPLHLKPLCT
ncbi:hypothetical protein H6H03_18355 [Nostoc paludosum FACHB-159]|uniref:Uncharacterized protein n=1 Tax=Nostoc paludosum FACHB-159 TaxID=2692908 RepID=A0ABR8K8N6_9NOSO|nr:hypothetical protein [Nostoc paludosum FACHB-159]